MKTDSYLKQIEKKSWTVYFQDGLWDIYMGLLMLMIGINTFVDNEWYSWLMIAPILLTILGKRFITTPRLGRVRFGSERQKKRIAVLIVIALAVICGTIIAVFSANGDPLPKAAAAAIFGISALLVFGSMAYFLDYKRFYIYGLMLATAFVLDILINEPLVNTSFLVFGAVAILVGLAMLKLFLRKYPKESNMQHIEKE